jgi:formylglycine-generating enzyme required for sulfatase activity
MSRLLLLLLAAVSSLLAQTTAKRIIPISGSDVDAFEKQRKIALLVGVAEYPNYSGIGRLAYPPADVGAIGDQLRAQGYTVIRLIDSQATRGSVRGALRNIREVLDQQDGTLVFFFSGHGWAPEGRNFLATFDAEAGNLGGSGIALDEVLQAMQATGAKRRVAWIDACRNEPGKSVGSSRVMAALNRSEGTRVLFSTRAGRLSYEDPQLKQGVFSHFLARALKGEAARGDGLVTFRDVADYVIENVQQYGLGRGDLQIPYEAGEASGDFLIARGSAARVDPTPTPVVTGPQVGDVRVNPKDGLRYAWIPPGTFRMGCSEGDGECRDNEKPARDVTIGKGFWMGQTEVTVDAFKRFAAATGRSMPEEPVFKRKLNPGWANGSMPMVMVDWNEAKGYCEWAGGRLPTEAEWEYAARAGSTAARYASPDVAGWFGDNSGKERLDALKLWNDNQKGYGNKLAANGNGFHPVGLKAPNAFSLYDMLGNVWEWTADWYDENYYQGGERRNPQGPPNGQYRVLRGGSWVNYSRYLRVSYRVWVEPAARLNNFGFRCGWE